MYIADTYNNRIRKVTVSTGIISTIAGSSTSGSYSGDNGVAISATLYYPWGVALDALGNIYIADQLNNRIRKVTVSTQIPTVVPTAIPSTNTSSQDIISTIAGNGNGDSGSATCAILNKPQGIALDSSGNFYIADNYNHRIRKVNVTTGIITTIAGTGSGSYSGDNGAATSAALYYPYGVALDASGRIL